ncbi:MAG: restriction endonuclease subunit S [Microcystis aeruginosa L111-01]|jgi:type I restriction enzyme S subunit|nr:restriction endonuclease subunit S [Microcystis aeruginosa W13-16]NCQ75700.1 restriction endonuclease subunit S [Microcystis aeruginosa W13-13]NCQ80137.1 restriction endonuclease subunit S [Microcystis aeruginosa W13-15]NCR23909.1 restriction endonuclease subunit S [Microcystis aeruginosa L111-01]NCS45560.1 restriction endonuclease subunit S [Microcystis aeruginosa BS11-05]
MRFLPETWILIPLGDCCQIISGSTPKRNKPEYWGGDIPWVTPKDLSKLRTPVLEDAPEKITEAGYKSCSTTLLPQGSILFSSRAPIGYVAIAGRPMCTNQGFKSLVPNEYVHSPYLYWCMRQYASDIEALGSGTTFKEVSKGIVERFKIPLPPLEEQRRIAAILDKADGVRRKRKEAIRLTEELLKSTFLEMFGDPVTNPKGWRKISLGELLAEPLQNGAYFPKERYVEAPDGVEMVHMSDAFYNFVERGNLKRVQVTSEEFEKYKLIPNDVLIARRSLNYEGSAKPCLISETAQPLIFESSLIRVRLNAEVIDSFFFFSYMLEPRARSAYVFPNVTKSTISGINQAGLKRISVLAPPMSIQKKYRDIYETILGTQSNYQKDYENIDNLFNSLLQRAFRGEL